MPPKRALRVFCLLPLALGVPYSLHKYYLKVQLQLDRCAIRFLAACALFWFLVTFTMPLTPPEDPSASQVVKSTDDVHIGYYRGFFRAFERLEGNETSVKSWLKEFRHANSHLSTCVEGGDVYDYIDQLKALMLDMSMILGKGTLLFEQQNFECTSVRIRE